MRRLGGERRPGGPGGLESLWGTVREGGGMMRRLACSLRCGSDVVTEVLEGKGFCMGCDVINKGMSAGMGGTVFWGISEQGRWKLG